MSRKNLKASQEEPENQRSFKLFGSKNYNSQIASMPSDFIVVSEFCEQEGTHSAQSHVAHLPIEYC
jgi:hypothetical protein